MATSAAPASIATAASRARHSSPELTAPRTMASTASSTRAVPSTRRTSRPLRPARDPPARSSCIQARPRPITRTATGPTSAQSTVRPRPSATVSTPTPSTTAASSTGQPPSRTRSSTSGARPRRVGASAAGAPSGPSSGMSSQSHTYRARPAPPSRLSSARAARTRPAGIPRCRASPAATPDTGRSAPCRINGGRGAGAGTDGVGMPPSCRVGRGGTSGEDSGSSRMGGAAGGRGWRHDEHTRPVHRPRPHVAPDRPPRARPAPTDWTPCRAGCAAPS